MPSVWKNQFEYPGRLMKIINKDKKFFSFLTKVNEKGKPSVSIKKAQNPAPEKTESFNNTKTQDTNYFNFTNNNPIPTAEDLEKVERITSTSKFSPNHVSKKLSSSPQKLGRTFTEKDVRDILDNYKEIYQHKKTKETESLHNNTVSVLPKLKGFTSKSNLILDHLNSTQKSQLFKSTIYNSMLPFKKTGTQASSHAKHSFSQTTTSPKSKTEYGPFLNFDYEGFNKKVEITNPEVKKLLEDVNYYGPRFSHCPSCRNRNLEFYETLEPHQCVNVLQFIKKERKKMTISK